MTLDEYLQSLTLKQLSDIVGHYHILCCDYGIACEAGVSGGPGSESVGAFGSRAADTLMKRRQDAYAAMEAEGER